MNTLKESRLFPRMLWNPMWIVPASGTALLLVFPWFGSLQMVNILVFVFTYAIFAASWDLIAGYAGQINLGPVFTFGIAGFVTAVLSLHTNYPLWMIMILATLVATVAGFVIAFPSLRLRGQYFAIFTFAAGIIAQNVALILYGEEGLSNGTRQLFGGDIVSSYYLALILLIASCSAMYLIGRSATGLKFKAIREDAFIAEVLGVNSVTYKLLAFLISSFFSSLAGSFLTLYLAHVDYNIFSYTTSFQIMAMAIVGGFGTIIGPIIGTFLLYVPSAMLIGQGVYSLIVYGALIVVVMTTAREGLVPNFLRLAKSFGSRDSPKS